MSKTTGSFEQFLSPMFVFAAFAVMICGCGSRSSNALRDFKKLNSTNVARVRTCFMMYASRNQWRSPATEDDLLEFLRSGAVDKNLRRAGIDTDLAECIFVSERDGLPLRIRWGIDLRNNADAPIAFEEEGVDGVRLVAANIVLEVDSDELYEKLWQGEYQANSGDVQF